MYKIKLNDDEIRTLGWCAVRGYFPEEAYDGLTLADGEPEEVAGGVERVWELEEHEAWSIPLLMEEDPDSFGACMGTYLIGKVLDLWERIV